MIRRAEVADISRLEECAKEFYAKSRFLRGFDMERFTAAWTGLLESGIGVVYILENSGDMAGAIGGVRFPDINSGEMIATEFFWFVREGQRGGGLRLYKALEAWARESGCTQIRMAYLADSMPDQLARIYERLGFEAAEIHYVKEL